MRLAVWNCTTHQTLTRIVFHECAAYRAGHDTPDTEGGGGDVGHDGGLGGGEGGGEAGSRCTAGEVTGRVTRRWREVERKVKKQ